MENKTSRNSIILKNLNSPFIEQAIFILKKGNDDDCFGDDVVDEAQKIIDNFIKRRHKNNLRQKRIKTAVCLAPIISALTLIAFIAVKLF